MLLLEKATSCLLIVEAYAVQKKEKLNMMKKTALSVVMVLSMVMFLSMNVAAEPDTNASNGKIDINSASAEELTYLNGVGKVIAEKIVAHRTANGPFQTPADIMKVKGIGNAMYEKNKEMITVGSLPTKK